MWDGMELGEWTSWHVNGNIKSVGYYAEGRKDSLWQWYDESGILTGLGMYDEDVEHGTYSISCSCCSYLVFQVITQQDWSIARTSDEKTRHYHLL